ncbi:uncharacterized protein LOC142241847 isoform X2 [Haematobia irritans]
MANIRFFVAVLLIMWRRRRNDVKRLVQEVEDLKKGAIKARNKLHIFNTLLSVEQKRNDELNLKLKQSDQDSNRVKSTYEGISNSIRNMKIEISLLEHENQTKNKEIEILNQLLSQSKDDLLKMSIIQRQLQDNLSMEQSKIEKLINERGQLIKETNEVKLMSEQIEQKLRIEIAKYPLEIEVYEGQIEDLQKQITMLESVQQQQISEARARAEDLNIEIERLETEVKILTECLQRTFSKRLKKCGYIICNYSQQSLHVFHWMIHFLLPATPPPKSSIFPKTLEKNVKIS